MPASSSGCTDPAQPIAGYRLPRIARLRTPGEFRRVYGRGRRANGRLLVVVAYRRNTPGHRIGLAVSKEHGGAVRRNKLKRILREAFRLERPTLPGAFDMVLIPRVRPGRLELDDARRELVALVADLCAEPARDGGRRRRDRRGPPR